MQGRQMEWSYELIKRKKDVLLQDRLPELKDSDFYPEKYSERNVITVNIKVIKAGTAGIKGSGFFGKDWSVDMGDFIWKE